MLLLLKLLRWISGVQERLQRLSPAWDSTLAFTSHHLLSCARHRGISCVRTSEKVPTERPVYHSYAFTHENRCGQLCAAWHRKTMDTERAERVKGVTRVCSESTWSERVKTSRHQDTKKHAVETEGADTQVQKNTPSRTESSRVGNNQIQDHQTPRDTVSQYLPQAAKRWRGL